MRITLSLSFKSTKSYQASPSSTSVISTGVDHTTVPETLLGTKGKHFSASVIHLGSSAEAPKTTRISKAISMPRKSEIFTPSLPLLSNAVGHSPFSTEKETILNTYSNVLAAGFIASSKASFEKNSTSISPSSAKTLAVSLEIGPTSSPPSDAVQSIPSSNNSVRSTNHLYSLPEAPETSSSNNAPFSSSTPARTIKGLTESFMNSMVHPTAVLDPLHSPVTPERNSIRSTHSSSVKQELSFIAGPTASSLSNSMQLATVSAGKDTPAASLLTTPTVASDTNSNKITRSGSITEALKIGTRYTDSSLSTSMRPTPLSTGKTADITTHSNAASMNPQTRPMAVPEKSTSSALVKEPLTTGPSPTGSSLSNSIRPTPLSTAMTADISTYSNAASMNPQTRPMAVPEKSTSSALVKEPLTTGPSLTGSSFSNSIRPTPLSTAMTADISTYSNAASADDQRSPASVREINTFSTLVKEPLTTGPSPTGSSLSNSLLPTTLSAAKTVHLSTHSNAASMNPQTSPTAVPEKNTSSALVKEPLTTGPRRTGSSLSNSIRPTPLSTAMTADISTYSNAASADDQRSPASVCEINTFSTLIKEPLTTGPSPTGSSLSNPILPTALSTAETVQLITHSNAASMNTQTSPTVVPEKSTSSALIKEQLIIGPSPTRSSLSNSILPTALSTAKTVHLSTHSNAASMNPQTSPTAVPEKSTSYALVKEPLTTGPSPTGSSLSNSIRPTPLPTAMTADISTYSNAASMNPQTRPMAVPEKSTSSALVKEPLTTGPSRTGSSLSNSIRSTPLPTAMTADISTYSNAASADDQRSPASVREINTFSTLVKEPLTTGPSPTGSSLSNSILPTALSTAKTVHLSTHSNAASMNPQTSPTAVPEKSTSSALVKEPLTTGSSPTGSSLSNSILPTALPTAKTVHLRTHSNAASMNPQTSPTVLHEKSTSSALVKEPLTTGPSPTGSSLSNSIRPTPLSTEHIRTHSNAASMNPQTRPMAVPEKSSSSALVEEPLTTGSSPTGSSLSNSILPTALSTAKTVHLSTHSNAASMNPQTRPTAVPEKSTSSALVKEPLTTGPSPTGSSLSNSIRPTLLSTDHIRTHSNAASMNPQTSPTAAPERKTSSALIKEQLKIGPSPTRSSLSNSILPTALSTAKTVHLSTHSNAASMNTQTSPTAAPERKTSSALIREQLKIGPSPTGSSMSNSIRPTALSTAKTGDISTHNAASTDALRSPKAVPETRRNSIASSGPVKEASMYGVSPTWSLSSNSIRLASLSPEKGADRSSGKIVASASLITSTASSVEISSISMNTSKSTAEKASAQLDPAFSSSSSDIQPTTTTAFHKASSVMFSSAMPLQAPLFSSRSEELRVSRSPSAMLVYASKHPSIVIGLNVLSTESNASQSEFTASFAASLENSSVLSSLSTATKMLMTSQIRSAVIEAIPTIASNSKNALSSSKNAKMLQTSSNLFVASFSIATKNLAASEMLNANIEATPTTASISISVTNVTNAKTTAWWD
eukprot:Seg2569.4 transcript_id=Seg2569.4/GoldUCD/mRNA.D3Y31 product="hypothetical protein" protein_id=Seg2569.4/GoldUCD/D3Y31